MSASEECNLHCHGIIGCVNKPAAEVLFMQASVQAQSLNRQALTSFETLFASLAPPLQATGLAGVYRAEFVGPAWLRRIAPPGLALGGLGSWWGKRFDGQGHGHNLVNRRGELTPVLPMIVQAAPSRLDGKDGITLCYPAGSPFPWPWVIDEIRQLDPTTLLGMSLTTLQWMPRLALPFLLHAQEHADGL
jgi:hypothetical protein